jgi:hypothetical protein
LTLQFPFRHPFFGGALGRKKNEAFSRTGEAKATFEIKRRKPNGLQVFLKLPMQQKRLSFQIGFSKTRGFSRTGEAKATFEIKRSKPSGLQVFL